MIGSLHGYHHGNQTILQMLLGFAGSLHLFCCYRFLFQLQLYACFAKRIDVANVYSTVLFVAEKVEPMDTDEVDSAAEVTNGAASIGIPHRDLSVHRPTSAAEFFKKAAEKGEVT